MLKREAQRLAQFDAALEAAPAGEEDRGAAVMAPILLFKTKIQLVSRRNVDYRRLF